MILFLPKYNRQNNADVLTDVIKEIRNKFKLKEEQDITLIQISFDGNNKDDPPNLMVEDIFDSIKIQCKPCNFSSFINITYSDEKTFESGTVNRKAAKKFISLLH